MLPAPEPDCDLALREPVRLAFQRQQKFGVPVVPRPRPGRGTGAPSQTSSMVATSRTSRRPPSSGKTAPRGRRTWTDRPSRSIRSIKTPSPSRSPVSVAPPSAASRASGDASGATRPSMTPACVQNGASGRSACGSSQAAIPQAAAVRSAAVWRRTGNGARSGRPGIGRRFAQASRYALLARMKRQARRASHPRTCRTIAGRRDHQRAIASNPTVCSGAAVSLSRRVAFTPRERSGTLALAAGESRQPSV